MGALVAMPPPPTSQHSLIVIVNDLFRVRGTFTYILTSIFFRFSFWETAWSARYDSFGVACFEELSGGRWPQEPRNLLEGFCFLDASLGHLQPARPHCTFEAGRPSG